MNCLYTKQLNLKSLRYFGCASYKILALDILENLMLINIINMSWIHSYTFINYFIVKQNVSILYIFLHIRLRICTNHGHSQPCLFISKSARNTLSWSIIIFFMWDFFISLEINLDCHLCLRAQIIDCYNIFHDKINHSCNIKVSNIKKH